MTFGEKESVGVRDVRIEESLSAQKETHAKMEREEADLAGLVLDPKGFLDPI